MKPEPRIDEDGVGRCNCGLCTNEECCERSLDKHDICLPYARQQAKETVSATNQTERLIYAAMVEAGWICPTTLEQVAAAEKELAENPIELPDELKDPKAFIARMENQNG